MERRRQTPGWTRGHSVAIGRHHPSDVLAGAYSMAILLANPEVQAVDPAQQIQLIARSITKGVTDSHQQRGHGPG